MLGMLRTRGVLDQVPTLGLLHNLKPALKVSKPKAM